MSIYVDEATRILVQGVTGKEGSFWTKNMKEMGSAVVAGVTPGKEGRRVEGVPVYHSVRNAVREHRVDASMIFVPPRFVLDAVMEALDAGIRKIVAVADGIPLHEAALIRKLGLKSGAAIIGGNTTGIISPGKAMMGCFPYWIERVYRPGRIGVMTRSGSLTNEVTAMVVRAGFGVSTLAGVGGDSVPATRFAELLPLYQQDKDTDAVVIIGELGGTMEEEVAGMMASGAFTKPVVAYLSGRTAPRGTRMGHAGDVISGGRGSVEDKAAILRAAGARVAMRPAQTGELLRDALGAKA